MSGPMDRREVIFETSYIGNIARVAAVDVATGIEAVMQGPRNAGEAVLKNQAFLKLKYVLQKEGILV